jgi:hypothetical protein
MACKEIDDDIQLLTSLLLSHTIYKKYCKHNKHILVRTEVLMEIKLSGSRDHLLTTKKISICQLFIFIVTPKDRKLASEQVYTIGLKIQQLLGRMISCTFCF